MIKWEPSEYPYKFSKKFSRKYLYKVTHLGFDEDDLMQECFIVFFKCSQKFDFSKYTERYFMNYFIKALWDMIIKLEKKVYKETVACERYVAENYLSPEDIFQQMEYNISISLLPDEMKQYLNDIGSGSTEYKRGIRKKIIKELQ